MIDRSATLSTHSGSSGPAWVGSVCGCLAAASWEHVGYRDLAEALDQIDSDALERTSNQFSRYRALTHRLVALAEAVDPAQALDEQSSATDVVAQLPGGGLDGAIARMRFSGLAQVIQTHFDEIKPFEVGGDRGGIITYWRRLADKRGIGWQFQENQLRFFINVEEPDLRGEANRAVREAVVEAEQTEAGSQSGRSSTVTGARRARRSRSAGETTPARSAPRRRAR